MTYERCTAPVGSCISPGRRNSNSRLRIHAGLNKGEVRNALVWAVFFYCLGELRDRAYENQRYRASGLNLFVAAILLRNTAYLDYAWKPGTGTRCDALYANSAYP